MNENLSEYQVEVLESQRDVFDKEFHHSFSLFPVMVYSSDAVDYRSISPNLRDLNIEAIIHQNPDYFDGQKYGYFYEFEHKECAVEVSNSVERCFDAGKLTFLNAPKLLTLPSGKVLPLTISESKVKKSFLHRSAL